MGGNQGEGYLQNPLSKGRSTIIINVYSTKGDKLEVFLVSSLFVAEKLAGVSKPVFDSMRLFLFSMEESTRTVVGRCANQSHVCFLEKYTKTKIATYLFS